MEIEVGNRTFWWKWYSTNKYTPLTDVNRKNLVLWLWPFLFKSEIKGNRINTGIQNFKETLWTWRTWRCWTRNEFRFGLLNFFGSNTKKKFMTSVWESNGNGKQLNLKSILKPTPLRIRIKTINLVGKWKIDGQGLLTFSEIYRGNGSYFTMTL